jgi:hypothetical protein
MISDDGGLVISYNGEIYIAPTVPCAAEVPVPPDLDGKSLPLGRLPSPA